MARFLRMTDSRGIVHTRTKSWVPPWAFKEEYVRALDQYLPGFERHMPQYLAAALFCLFAGTLPIILRWMLPFQFLGGCIALPKAAVLGFATASCIEPYKQGKLQAFLHLGLCPTCDAPLKGYVPDPDGCTVCPECGAAWRLPATPGPGVQ